MQIKTLFSLALAGVLATACTPSGNNANTEQSGQDSTVVAPAVTTEADKLAAADALMQKIDAAKGEQKVEKKRFMNNAMNMAHDQSIYTIYSQEGQMVKLEELMGESMYLAEVANYYQDGKIVLIHSKLSFDDNVYRETKTYLEEGNPFAVMGREKAEDDQKTDLKAMPFAKMELAKAIPNMEEFMKGLAETPKRLAASKTEK